MQPTSKLTVIAALLASLSCILPVSAEWSADPAIRTPVASAEHRQYFPKLVQVKDGFIVTWQDTRRYNTHVDVYAQKFDINGEMLWPENGRVIAAGPENSLVYHLQRNAGLIHDGNGGALIAWNDDSGSGYLQAFASRLTSAAMLNWGASGEAIQSGDTAVPMLANPVRGANRVPEDWGIAADSEKGVFIPMTSGLGRVSSDGRVRTKWFYDPSDTISVSRTLVPVVSSTGKDGVVVVWNQGNSYFSEGIRARKLVDPESLWPAGLDTLSNSWGQKVVYQPDHSISVCRLRAVPDGSGGVIAVWVDGRVVTDTAHFRVYAQRIDSSGQLMWGQQGVQVSDDVTTYSCYWWSKLVAVADGEGGVVIAWNDGIAGKENVWAQRVNASGGKLWSAEGVVLATNDNAYYHFTTHGLVRATDGNFIVLYDSGTDELLTTQKLGSAQGAPLWGAGQVVYEGCFSPYNAGDAAMVSDGQAGAIVAWEACDNNIYAHRVVETSALSRMNAGMNDAWYNPQTDGQGFFITVFPDLNAVSLAWFTYDTELPPPGAVANLGDPGHRWLTAMGPISGNQSLMNIELTSGGIFDTATTITRTDPPGSDGTLKLTFHTCNSGTIEYDIPSINRSGSVPIQRVANDNIVMCEALDMD
jgi:hypothetical protein